MAILPLQSSLAHAGFANIDFLISAAEVDLPYFVHSIAVPDFMNRCLVYIADPQLIGQMAACDNITVGANGHALPQWRAYREIHGVPAFRD
jgi:hypothetical protein